MTLPTLRSRNAIEVLSTMHTLPPLSQLAFALSVLVMTWEMRARTRKALAKMTADDLTDIGLSADEARREAGRFFWQG
jgi:uncharacterized protein YjiS (DUF1127 family)